MILPMIKPLSDWDWYEADDKPNVIFGLLALKESNWNSPSKRRRLSDD